MTTLPSIKCYIKDTHFRQNGGPWYKEDNKFASMLTYVEWAFWNPRLLVVKKHSWCMFTCAMYVQQCIMIGITIGSTYELMMKCQWSFGSWTKVPHFNCCRGRCQMTHVSEFKIINLLKERLMIGLAMYILRYWQPQNIIKRSKNAHLTLSSTFIFMSSSN